MELDALVDKGKRHDTVVKLEDERPASLFLLRVESGAGVKVEIFVMLIPIVLLVLHIWKHTKTETDTVGQGLAEAVLLEQVAEPGDLQEGIRREGTGSYRVIEVEIKMFSAKKLLGVKKRVLARSRMMLYIIACCPVRLLSQ